MLHREAGLTHEKSFLKKRRDPALVATRRDTEVMEMRIAQTLSQASQIRVDVREDEDESGMEQIEMQAQPPPIPELGVDYEPNLRRTRTDAFDFNAEHDHEDIGIYLQEWARKKGLTVELTSVFRHYAAGTRSGMRLQSTQFLRFASEAQLHHLVSKKRHLPK